METNILYNEDCEITLSKIGDKSVDLVVTSPPYNMRTRVSNNKYTTRENTKHFSKKYKHFDDALPIDEFYELHSRILNELLRVSKIVCYNFQIVTGSKEAFFKIIGNFNTKIKDIIIWDKGYGQPAMHENVLNSVYEMILVMEDDNKLGRLIQNAKFSRGEMDNVFRVQRDKTQTDVNGALFPEKLAAKLIEAFSSEGDVVYDPFTGSGTTPAVCEKLNRKWIGSELVEEQYNQAIKRLEPLRHNLFTNTLK